MMTRVRYLVALRNPQPISSTCLTFRLSPSVRAFDPRFELRDHRIVRSVEGVTYPHEFVDAGLGEQIDEASPPEPNPRIRDTLKAGLSDLLCDWS